MGGQTADGATRRHAHGRSRISRRRGFHDEIAFGAAEGKERGDRRKEIGCCCGVALCPAISYLLSPEPFQSSYALCAATCCSLSLLSRCSLSMKVVRLRLSRRAA